MKYAVPPPPATTLPVASDGPGGDVFPVHRIYCVGQNYSDHVLEMGGDPTRDPPFFFSKPRDSIVPCYGQAVGCSSAQSSSSSPTRLPYPLATRNLHYEIELVVAIGKEGEEIETSEAEDYVFGFAVGVDLTRRDLQAAAKQSGRPWDSSKGFDQSAPMSPVCRKEKKPLDTSSRIWLDVNGKRRQSSQLDRMTWSVPEIVSILSHQFRLVPGDLIMTGTPSGIGPLEVGDVVAGGVEGLGQIGFTIVERCTSKSGE